MKEGVTSGEKKLKLDAMINAAELRSSNLRLTKVPSRWFSATVTTAIHLWEQGSYGIVA